MLTDAQKTCEHANFRAEVDVHRITEGDGGAVSRFNADVRVRCSVCDLPFVFLGLPAGLDLDGAAMNVTGEEAHLAIAPRGVAPTPMDGVTGFRMSMMRGRAEASSRVS